MYALLVSVGAADSRRASLLGDHIERATVSCQPRDRDRYGRIVAVCFKGNEDLNRWMVANGWAVAFRRYSLDYVANEDVLDAVGNNIWSGDFDMPWHWRAQQRSIDETTLFHEIDHGTVGLFTDFLVCNWLNEEFHDGKMAACG